MFSPQIPALAERGALRYLAVTSVDSKSKVAPALQSAKDLGALAIDVQLGDYDTPVAEAVRLAVRIRSVARELDLPFAIIRHLAPGTFWDRLREPAELLSAATQFHLRPFNGHHCQIPVLDAAGRRTPEYRDWQIYSAALFAHLRCQKTTEPVLAVPEMGNAAPAYGLSCFGDTWRDVRTLARDLRRQWRVVGRAPAG